ncbi:MAG: acyltransferase family protein [Deltaproteobacteria bacterium]|nr:acyltransferase family protein [Deltaproteobacteria bacterium]
MSKKDILFNPYRPGDEDHLYFNDSKILKYFLGSLRLVERYFRYDVVGIDNIPSRSPALLVLNHGFIPLDLILLGRRIYRQTGRRIRVLVHRRSWRIPVLREVALNIGMVDAKPENAVRLLKKGELVCVFPGGEREGMKPSGMKYQLMWEDRIGFVQTAVLAKAPIVPCMSVGIDDVYHIFEKSTRHLAGKMFHRYFPFPVFLGLGGLPCPRKIVHYLGKPIKYRLKPSEADNMKQIKKIHARVWSESEILLKKGLRERRWFE